MSKQQPSSTFESTVTALKTLRRTLNAAATVDDGHVDGSGDEPANSAAVVFAAIMQSRAIDRLTKAVEKNTRAVLVAGNITPDTAGLVDDPRWDRLAAQRAAEYARKAAADFGA